MLDAGCGTGENALHLASLGWPVLGFDVAETALAIARAKARDRGIEAEFVVADVLQLERLGRRTAGCSTPSTATSGRDTWRAWRR